MQELEPYTGAKKAKHLKPISTAADVWGIGKIIGSLLTVADVKQYRFDKPKQRPMNVPTACRDLYPSGLIDLVSRCLEPEPSKRPKPWDLGVDVRRCIADFVKDRESQFRLEEDGSRDERKLAHYRKMLNHKFRYGRHGYLKWAR